MAPKEKKQEAQNPLILRSHRLMDAFAKSDDERDFYLDRLEGFIIYVDLDKPQPELGSLEDELQKNAERYCMIPKLTFYETKKIMEGFVNEKVYDIDTKEKLLDIIQSKEAREHFLEFIYDHHSELEKWQQFYQERSRIRIIEWLRNNHFHFVFEEDLDMPKSMLEKLKRNLFENKVAKDILVARKGLVSKAKTYYSSEALNPRPKRGRPPKQAIKQEIEPQVTTDIYTTVPAPLRPFLFIPDISSGAVNFSSKFENQEQMLGTRRNPLTESESSLESLNQKLAVLRSLSSSWDKDKGAKSPALAPKESWGDKDDDDDDDDDSSGLNGWGTPHNNQDEDHLSKKKSHKRSIIKAPKPPVKKKGAATATKKPPIKTSKKPGVPKIKLIPRSNEISKGKPKQKIQSKRPSKMTVGKKSSEPSKASATKSKKPLKPLIKNKPRVRK